MPFKSGNINPGTQQQQTNTTGPISVVIYESNDPRKTEAAVYKALNKVVNRKSA
jgi:hypothetical protein